MGERRWAFFCLSSSSAASVQYCTVLYCTVPLKCALLCLRESYAEISSLWKTQRDATPAGVGKLIHLTKSTLAVIENVRCLAGVIMIMIRNSVGSILFLYPYPHNTCNLYPSRAFTPTVASPPPNPPSSSCGLPTSRAPLPPPPSPPLPSPLPRGCLNAALLSDA